MFELFKNQPVVYGLSQKADGNMHLAFSNSPENRIKFFTALKLGDKKVFSADLTHGINVVKIHSDDRNTILPKTDALILSEKDAILTITVADCFPVYFFDPKNKAVALAHCGWRGTAANLAAKVVESMGSNPAEILVGIGPGIQACHFEVKNDVLNKFSGYSEAIIKLEGKIFIDLPKIIINQLTSAGVKTENIENTDQCTYCSQEKYFSFRRDKPKKIEAMLAFIGLNKFYLYFNKQNML